MPDIVYVDNEPNELVQKATLEQKARIRPFVFDKSNPEENEAAFAAASDASLLLFDFFLLDEQVPSENSENGLSLFNKWRSVISADRPVTVLVSSDLEKAIGEPIGPVERHHVLAQRLGVEWIGDKSDQAIADTIARVIALADASIAIRQVLEAVEGNDSGDSAPLHVERICFDVLGASKDARWANSAQRQVDRARPPRIETPSAGFGAARPIVAWLVGHALPYPSFLISDAQAAVRLGLTPASFRSLVEAKAEAFGLVCYDGPLRSFLKRRWWRAGIDDLVWKESQGPEPYRERLQNFAGAIQLDWLEMADPVVVADDRLVETEDIADASQCVRATDEDFPSNVDPAWVSLEEAKGDRILAAKVIFDDRPLLEPDE